VVVVGGVRKDLMQVGVDVLPGHDRGAELEIGASLAKGLQARRDRPILDRQDEDDCRGGRRHG